MVSRVDWISNIYNLFIGSFTAASNASGIIAPIEETTALLHKYGAFSFWDYATAAPYLDVNMSNKDAVFISTHKYLAGYDNSNPFVILIFDSYLSYSGKRANHCEFIDLREQRKWCQHHDISENTMVPNA
eukprot:650599_1